MFAIRPVENTKVDLAALTKFCSELAEFDGHIGKVTLKKLKDNMFCPGTGIRAFLGCIDQSPIGFILAYECFSVYSGERGLCVSGAYVSSEYRHKGYGVKLFRYLLKYAVENNFEFMNWIVDADNENANAIYRKIGAEISNGWSYVRFSTKALSPRSERILASEGLG